VQIAAFKSAGCELIFQEKATAAAWERHELHRLLKQLPHDGADCRALLQKLVPDEK
jgi:hypothetical protein